MAQLTSLRSFAEKRNSDENLKAHAAGSTNVPTETSKKNSGNIDRKLNRANRQKSRRSLTNGHSGQRQDLGTVNIRPDLGRIEKPKEEEKSLVEGFVGSISSLLFGRKGGLL